MKIDIADGFEYIPEYNGNRELPEKEQIKIHFTYLSVADYTELLRSGKIDKKEEWLKICEKVDNLEVNEKKYTAEDLYKKKGLALLYGECYEAFKAKKEIE